jgi:D-tyrosyl-tRNA(Tyr) deacylase
MRAVVQRVSQAEVQVAGERVGAIGRGLAVLLGVGPTDQAADADWMVEKIAHLRIFPDAEGRMNLSVRDIGGGVLVVSQFTLYGDVVKGRRPSFTGAAAPAIAEPLVERVAAGLAAERGRFGADMQLHLINDGPVTLILDSPSHA